MLISKIYNKYITKKNGLEKGKKFNLNNDDDDFSDIDTSILINDDVDIFNNDHLNKKYTYIIEFLEIVDSLNNMKSLEHQNYLIQYIYKLYFSNNAYNKLFEDDENDKNTQKLLNDFHQQYNLSINSNIININIYDPIVHKIKTDYKLT